MSYDRFPETKITGYDHEVLMMNKQFIKNY